MEVITIKFQELWDDFVSSFKGKLLTESAGQGISFVAAKLSLSDAVLTWTSEYTINGRWLYNLIKEEPEKGKLVKEIITKDISITEVKSECSNSDKMKYMIPLGAGVVGYGVAYSIGLATIGTVCATLLPMIVAYPVTATHLSNRRAKEEEKIINDYVNQLNKYKEAVMSALIVS